MVLSVSARSPVISFKPKQGGEDNELRLLLSGGLFFHVTYQPVSRDLLPVTYLPLLIKNGYLASLKAGVGGRKALSEDEASRVSFFLDRHRARVGRRPIIHAKLDGNLLRVFLPDAHIVDARWVWPDKS